MSEAYDIQLEIWGFVNYYTRTHGYSPTVREIAEWIERSPSTTNKWIKQMLKDGMLTGKPHMARTLRAN